MKRIRGIIYTLNLIVAVLATVIVASEVFADIRGWRFVLIVVAGIVAINEVLTGIENQIIRSGRNEKSGKGTNNKGTIPGIMWHENRLSMAEPKDRHPRANIKTI